MAGAPTRHQLIFLLKEERFIPQTKVWGFLGYKLLINDYLIIFIKHKNLSLGGFGFSFDNVTTSV